MAFLQARTAVIGQGIRQGAKGENSLTHSLAILAAFTCFFAAALYRFGVFSMLASMFPTHRVDIEQVSAQCVAQIEMECAQSKDCAGKLADWTARKAHCISNRG